MITFPEYTGDKGIYSEGDWHFVGWSTDSQANEAGDGHYTQTVYRPGDTYRIPDDRQSDIDFYAIWAQENVKAKFFIFVWMERFQLSHRVTLIVVILPELQFKEL